MSGLSPVTLALSNLVATDAEHREQALETLSNHARATAAQHHGYHVIDGTRTTSTAPAIQTFWERVTG